MQRAVARKRHWTLDDIPWAQFDAAQVDPDILKVVKAAAMVEHNGGDYAGLSLQRLPRRPGFPGRAAGNGPRKKCSTAGRSPPGRGSPTRPSISTPASSVSPTASRSPRSSKALEFRGSRSGELVARCIVETGTSPYYAALKDATAEPVLKEICRNIAAERSCATTSSSTIIRAAIWRRRRSGAGSASPWRCRACARARTTRARLCLSCGE